MSILKLHTHIPIVILTKIISARDGDTAILGVFVGIGCRLPVPDTLRIFYLWTVINVKKTIFYTHVNGDRPSHIENSKNKKVILPYHCTSSYVNVQQYHSLYGSTSCCISHGPCQWERAIFDPPQLRDPWTDFHET